jgi:hypothetical protein
MSSQIGFIILSHNNPQHLLRLVRRLQQMYDNPPIVCHHDFGQCNLRRDDFPSEVRFVTPHIDTRWGRFEVVSATLRSLELLYSNAAPDWFALLSGADYPTMGADGVLKGLSLSNADALIDFREAVKTAPSLPYTLPENPALAHFVSPGNLKISWNRYVGFNAWVPIIRPGPRLGRYTIYLPFEAWGSPFGPNFKCYYGDHWFTANRKAAEILLHPTDRHIRLRRHLQFRIVPEECYYHSVLGNAPGLNISKATKRFSEWLGGGAHPQTLGLNDLPSIVSSKAHFARKFAPDTPVLDEIDKLLAEGSL